MEQSMCLDARKISENKKIVLYFIVYSFIGWIFETIYAIYVHGYFVKRGFLFGPICPIYGFGGVLLYLSLKNVRGNKCVKFLIAMVVFTIFECISSYLLEILFHQRWWDYSNEFLNFQGRICLSFSIIWGLAGVIFIETIHPYTHRKIENLLLKIPYYLQNMVVYAFAIYVCSDFILSVLKYSSVL